MNERSRKIAVSGAAFGLGAALIEILRGEGHATIGVDLPGSDVDAHLGADASRRQAIDTILERCGGPLDGGVLASLQPDPFRDLESRGGVRAS